MITDQPVHVGDLCRFRRRSHRLGRGDRPALDADPHARSAALVTIPNADFAQRELENLAARDRIRIHAVLGLRYETTPDQLRAVLDGLRRLIGGHPLVSPDLLRIYFVGFGTTSLDVEVSAYVRTTDLDEFSAVREDLFLRMIDTIAQCGTALARPINLPTVGTPPASARRRRPPSHPRPS